MPVYTTENPLKHVLTLKRGNTWSYRFEKAKKDGKRQQAQKGGYATREDALMAGIKAYETYITGQGDSGENSNMSLADYLDFWFEQTKIYAKNSTLELREKAIRLHLKPSLGAYPINGLTPQIIDNLIQQKRKSGYSYLTTQKILSILVIALEYAIWPMQLIEKNPAKFIKVPGENFSPLTNRKARRRLENDEIDKLFTWFPFGSSYHMPFMIALYFGTRLGETIGLSWEDCDLNRRVLQIRHQIQRLAMHGKHELQYLCKPKTIESNRSLYFDEKEMLPLLLRWKEQQKQNEQNFGNNYFYNYLIPATDYQGRPIQQIVALQKNLDAPGPRLNLICTQLNGKHFSQSTFANVCRKIRRQGIRDFNFHTLRHTNLTMLGEAQVMPTDIMARAGHTNYNTTLNYYIDNRPEMQIAPVKILSQKMKQLFGEQQ